MAKEEKKIVEKEKVVKKKATANIGIDQAKYDSLVASGVDAEDAREQAKA